jgi:glucosamine 6-phosphate synthetase-like amidotransferase/phosphosugar isomerase protein
MSIKEFKKTPEGKKVYEDALYKKQDVINAENQLHLHYMSKEMDDQKEHCQKITGEIFPRLKEHLDYL